LHRDTEQAGDAIGGVVKDVEIQFQFRLQVGEIHRQLR